MCSERCKIGTKYNFLVSLNFLVLLKCYKFGDKAIITNSRTCSVLIVHRVLGDMTRDVTRYLFLAKRDMMHHITGDVTRYSF